MKVRPGWLLVKGQEIRQHAGPYFFGGRAMAIKRYEVRVSVSNILTYSVFMDEEPDDWSKAYEAIRAYGDKRIFEADDVDVLSIEELRS
jgi:hypothetical protein